MSPDNSIIPPLAEIIDDRGSVWTLNGVTSGKVLKNGALVHDKVGVNLVWVNDLLFVLGNDDLWYYYDYNTDDWIATGGIQPTPIGIIIISAYFHELQGLIDQYGDRIKLTFWDINNGGKYLLYVEAIP